MSYITSRLETSKHRNYLLYSLFMHKHRYPEISFSGHRIAENEQNETLNKEVQKLRLPTFGLGTIARLL